MLKLLVPVFVLLIALAVAVVSDRPAPPADFTFINSGDVNTLDLQRMSWMQDLRVARLLYEGLVHNDVFSRRFEITPGVAERWEVSPNGRVYTFHLRDDARWSNGEPVTASDFVYSWRRGLLPDVASDYAAFFTLIKGGQAFYDWRTEQLADFGKRPVMSLDPFTDRTAWTLFRAVRAVEPAIDAGTRQRMERQIRRVMPWWDQYARAAQAADPSAGPPDAAHDADVEEHVGRLSLLRDALSRARRHEADRLWRQTLEKFDQTVGLRAVDDRTLRVELVRPVPYFLNLCAFAVLYPVYPPLVSQYEQPDPETGRLKLTLGWTKPGRIVSNGPFELTKWRFKRDMRLSKNPHYWNRDHIYIDSIAIPSIEDPNAQVLAFDSGAVDWLSEVTPPYRADMLRAKRQFYKEHQAEYDRLKAMGLDPIEIDRRLPADRRKNIHAFPAFGTYFYNFNCLPTLPDGRDNPFADPRVRRAFAMAIDKERIVDQVRRLGEPVATTLIPPGSLDGYHSPKGLPFDPDRARRELAEAGYPNGKGFITVEILFNKDAGHDLIAQAISKDWKDNLGVNVLLQQKEVKVFRNDLKEHNFMVSRAGWYGDYGDPTTFLDINRTGDGNNDRSFSDPAYDELLDAAAAETDPDKRMRILEKAEAMIVDEQLPLVPIFHYSQICMFDPNKFTGISPHPRQQQDLYRVDVFGDGKGPDTPLTLPPVESDEPDDSRSVSMRGPEAREVAAP